MNTGLNEHCFKLLSWNIEGKHYILKNNQIKNSLNEYDILFIHETHCTMEMHIELDNYVSIQHPCTLSTKEHPRGGCIMFIKKNLMKFVKGFDKNFKDAIIVYMCQDVVVCGIYIPPDNSKYFDNQFDTLDVFTDQEGPARSTIVCGDLNSRTGSIGHLNGYDYEENVDAGENQNGRKLLELCRFNNIIPLNMLKYEKDKTFFGGFTYKKGDRKSQNDWILVSKCVVENVKEFSLVETLSNISDHTPVQTIIKLNTEISLDELNTSIIDVISEHNNHSHYKKLRTDNINLELFSNIMNTHINSISQKYDGIADIDTCSLANDIEESIRKSSNAAKLKRPNIHQEQPARSADINESILEDSRRECEEWKSVLLEKDPKKIWQKIDFNGKYKKNNIQPENNCNEFADYLEERCSLPFDHSYYEDINTNTVNETLDSRIEEEEILNGIKTMNKGSAAKCGISVGHLLAVLTPLLWLLTLLMNTVFTSKYPATWVPFICCLPKKGRLSVPYVRGISLKPLLAKIYDAILKNRLTKWLKIPEEQTAYQKGKGCYLHVFFVRCLISICRKVKKPLFIGVTDFEAAFDYISRRNLFKKLVSLGIGMGMLYAIIEMYKVTDAYVLLNGEYSKKLSITAGVLQGSASSTLLFMAYTSDLITLFRSYFPAEELIHYYHLLLHADDSLILATTKRSLIEKFRKLCEYCKINNIKLQLSKCGFLAINSDEKGPIRFDNDVIKNLDESLYLGSIITDSGNVSMDVKAEVKRKERRLNRFYAYLTQNRNAPLKVKEKVLESCILSAVIYNCETWGDAQLDGLEKKYRRALKYMLGVRRTTCNEFPYVELNKPTLTSVIHKRQLKFYNDCLINKDWPMQRYIIRQGLDSKCSFISHYEKLKRKYDDPNDIVKESLNRMKETIKLKAANDRSRYVSYLKVNPLLVRPSVYNRYVRTDKLHLVTRIRCISHSLEIELGRHHKVPIPRECRLCSCGEVEDEEHFLTSCHQYTHIRNEMFPTTTLHELLDHPKTPDYVYELTKLRKLYK